MAGYSDNRGQNYEVKYLRKVLSEVDEGIPVPPGVSGGALRAKLDHIHPDAKPAPNKKSGTIFGLRWFSWQSGITYAAAFALIVGLFYGLGLDRQQGPDIVPRDVTVTEPETPVTFSEADAEAPPPEQSSGGEDISGTAQPDTSGPEGTSESEPATPFPFSEAGDGVGVGGGGKSTVLGTAAGYTYTWRANDATDPDKGAYPVTVDIVSDTDARLAAQIDLEDMQSISAAYFTETALVMVGNNAQAVTTRSYDITDPQTPVPMAALSQPGAYVGSHLYENTVHTVTFTEDAAGLEGIDTETLPHALNRNACVIGAVDAAAHESAVKAFVGADNDITIYDLSAYISFMGAPEEPEAGGSDDGESAPDPAVGEMLYIAHIRMDGLDIHLLSVT